MHDCSSVPVLPLGSELSSEETNERSFATEVTVGVRSCCAQIGEQRGAFSSQWLSLEDVEKKPVPESCRSVVSFIQISGLCDHFTTDTPKGVTETRQWTAQGTLVDGAHEGSGLKKVCCGV
ncbi:hypothetical protein AOLI_G00222170 [Acnodon oligacanthus]